MPLVNALGRTIEISDAEAEEMRRADAFGWTPAKLRSEVARYEALQEAKAVPFEIAPMPRQSAPKAK